MRTNFNSIFKWINLAPYPGLELDYQSILVQTITIGGYMFLSEKHDTVKTMSISSVPMGQRPINRTLISPKHWLTLFELCLSSSMIILSGWIDMNNLIKCWKLNRYTYSTPSIIYGDLNISFPLAHAKIWQYIWLSY